LAERRSVLSSYLMSDVVPRGSQLQRLKSSAERLRQRARPAATRASDRLAEQLTVFSVLAGPVVVKLVAAIAVTGVLRKLTTPATQPARTHDTAPRAARIPPPFICDRELVAAMQL
jgi:hypothetical protein